MRGAGGASNFPIAACRHSNAMSADGGAKKTSRGTRFLRPITISSAPGDAWLMRSVLHHNALDLITLLQLAMLVVQ